MDTAAIITVSVCALLAWCATLIAAVSIAEMLPLKVPDRPRNPSPGLRVTHEANHGN